MNHRRGAGRWRGGSGAVAVLALAAIGAGMVGCGGTTRIEEARPPEPSSRPRPAVGPWFVDRASEFGLDVVPRSGDPAKRCVLDSLGVGVALLDLEGDGDLDLFVAGGSEVRDGGVRPAGGPWLFRNDGPGAWVDVSASSGLRHTGWAQGAAVADYDADGDPDLLVLQHGPDTLWRNRGDGTFEDATEAAGLGDPCWGVSASWGDVDGDGWPDLYVANYLDVDPLNPPPPNDYLPGHPVFQGPATLPGQGDRLWRNRGDGTFEEITEAAGLARAPRKGMSALLADLDDDGDTDLYVTNDTQANELFRNRGDGTFEEVGQPAGVAYNTYGIAEGSMAIDLADVNGDARLDLAISNFRQEGSRIFANLGDGVFEDVSGTYSLWDLSAGFVGWGLVLGDFDDDGFPDLFQANGHVYPDVPDARYDMPPLLLRNRDGGGMEDATALWGPALESCRSGRALASGDLDNDGDLDLVMTTIDGPLRVLINEGTRTGAAVTIRLVGRKPNTEALGALVEVQAGGRSQVGLVRRGGSIMAASDVRLHVGLGDSESIDAIRVRWPDGTEARFDRPPLNAQLTIRQGEPTLESLPFDRGSSAGRTDPPTGGPPA
ncbi:CRTAC1 family protein [Tautonia sociabilis]|uniref:CRTAC1 family protein n=1 Tax=Tautonia sociabilis TaxID=2080755 RepID=A0A432MNR3_9BACT|nr:CRTAC1 family protein [Tautonia sociabilis]RUL89074.1 CRTAC1 family protein [Tautonia sociabilis]